MKKARLWLVVSVSIVGSVMLFAACSQEKDTSMGTDEMPTNMDHNGMDHGNADKMPDMSEFANHRNDRTGSLIDAHSQIKAGLDASDKKKAADGAEMMIAALKKFDSSDLDTEKRKEFTEIFDTAKEHAEHIVKSDVKHQKEHFEELTTDLKDLFELVGAKMKSAG